MSTILEIEKQNTTKGWHAKDVRLINWESPKACYHHQAALDFFFLRQVFLMNCVLSEIAQIITVYNALIRLVTLNNTFDNN